ALTRDDLGVTWEFQRRYQEVLSRVKDRVLLDVASRLTVEDHVAWNRRRLRRASRSRWATVRSQLPLLLALLLCGLYGLFLGDWNWTLVTLIFGFGALVLFSPALSWWSAGS